MPQTFREEVCAVCQEEFVGDNVMVCCGNDGVLSEHSVPDYGCEELPKDPVILDACDTDALVADLLKQPEGTPVRLTCGHVIHSDCLVQSFEAMQKLECPLCTKRAAAAPYDEDKAKFARYQRDINFVQAPQAAVPQEFASLIRTPEQLRASEAAEAAMAQEATEAAAVDAARRAAEAAARHEAAEAHRVREEMRWYNDRRAARLEAEAREAAAREAAELEAAEREAAERESAEREGAASDAAGRVTEIREDALRQADAIRTRVNSALPRMFQRGRGESSFVIGQLALALVTAFAAVVGSVVRT
jgi:hypothetical protein